MDEHPEHRRLLAALAAAELHELLERSGADQDALELGRQASALGFEDLVQRARLLYADIVRYAGQNAPAAVIERNVLQWAQSHGDQYLLARAHRQHSSFYRYVGDASAALEHAVAAVDGQPDDVPLRMRADHLLCLGLAYGGIGSSDAARDRFLSVLAIADELGDQVLAVSTLNNLAYLEFLIGRSDRSLHFAQALTARAQAHGLTLSAATLDTVAHAQLSSGDFEAAERTLHTALHGPTGLAQLDDSAGLTLTLAQCQRQRGDLEAARRSLASAWDQCGERDLGYLRARLVEEQAALAAAAGDYREAYQRHQEFHRLEAQQASDERVAQARVLATVFERDEAVRTSKRYREMSLRDPLTGLYNRRYVEERLPGLLQRANDTASTLAVALLDLDHFKQVNDSCSHEAGDGVLQQFAQLVQRAVPPVGFAARFGGEEFLLVLPSHDLVQARQACERLLAAVRAHDWRPLVGPMPITASVGVSTTFAGADSLRDLLATADRLLYEAKDGGRDQVRGAPGPSAS